MCFRIVNCISDLMCCKGVGHDFRITKLLTQSLSIYFLEYLQYTGMFKRLKQISIHHGYTLSVVMSIICNSNTLCLYSKTCVKRPPQKDRKLVFKTNYRLMQVKSTAECSMGSILQYFRPSLSYHLLLKPLFCLFLSGRFTQILLYSQC